jgi:hypothetical protein
MTIDEWLMKFKAGWEQKEIDKVLELFSNNVEYWETPYKKLNSLEELKSEWQAIKDQSDINLSTSIFSSFGNNHAIQWMLDYIDANGTHQSWAGTYLVTLDEKGNCIFFHQTGETQNDSS